MYPLAFLDLSTMEEASNLVKPLWEAESKLHMRVYLSSKLKVDHTFLESEFEDQQNENVESSRDTVLLWKQDISSPSLSKSFLLTSLGCSKNDDDSSCGEGDASYKNAQLWLDEAEQLSDAQNGGILSTISAAGNGIESTSIILTCYQSLSNQFWHGLAWMGIVAQDPTNTNTNEPALAAAAAKQKTLLERSTIHLPSSSPMWSRLMKNSTIHVHVLVTREGAHMDHPQTVDEAAAALHEAAGTHSLLLGQVGLVKFDEANHLSQPGRILYHDLVYLFQKYIYVLQSKSMTQTHPPWDMEYAKPLYFASYQTAQEMKARGAGYPYWKPEVAVKYLIDQDQYPYDMATVSGMPLVRVKKSATHPTGVAHTPALHVDEIGLTSEKYIPVNDTLSTLPLRITFDRSDMEDKSRTQTTATAGGISPARWRLLTHLSASIESQKQLGFEQSDIDDLRRLIADTNITLLAITMLASALHLLFEFLTFKSEVSFWKNNTDLTGLSVRSLFLDMIGQVIIVLFLYEKDSSLLMTIPSAFGCVIALWKCQRAAGLAFVKMTADDKKQRGSFWNILPRLVGYELKATRLQLQKTDHSDAKKNAKAQAANDLHTLTIDADRLATKKLGTALLPMVVLYTLYSLLKEEHTGWYSWLITSASSAVYALGFVLMTPQLFLNYKMKSVAHLPWRVLVYKSLNTFIDDLFSFIIRMPTMARISCFRDDVVFFIYLYQRWLYPVDTSRPVEGLGEENPNATATDDNASNKKNQ